MKMLAALLFAVLAPVAGAQTGPDAPGSIASVEQGQIRGDRRAGIVRYLGLPYAAAPVGAMRWKAPADPSAWSGTRNATHFGAECFQFGNYFTSNDPATFEQPIGSEDCLYLNVWAPAGNASGRPVVVFIHGGSAIRGAASLPLYDGERLARELDAVFVSINYRLGYFGIINVAALRTGDPLDDSGSFALLDQIKALGWVQRNISGFGGDPARVTVMGHSAGCSSIWNLMHSPLAIGKLQKAICMSGLPQQSTDEKLAEPNRQFLARLLVADKLIADPDELDRYVETTSAATIRAWLYGKSSLDIITAAKGLKIERERVDGQVLTRGPDGPPVNPVSAILGSVADEAPLLFLRSYSPHNIGAMWKLIQSEDPLELADFFSGWFDQAKFTVVSWVTNRLLLNRVDKAAAMLAATSVPVYRYKFEWNKAPEPWRSLYGSYHGLDVPFVFGNFGLDYPNFTTFTWRESDPAELEALHRRMVMAFRSFIESGDPNRNADLGWPRWSDDSTAMVFR